MSRIRDFACLALAAAALLGVSRADAAYTVDCGFNNSGDFVDRAFYVSNYPGTSLQRVALNHRGATAGARTITLTARLSTYDGTFLGVASVTKTFTTTYGLTVFDFGNIPVAAGSRITFIQSVISGSDDVYFDVGIGPCTGITETNGSTPPLSSARNNTVGLVIEGDPNDLEAALILDCPYDPDENRDNVSRGFYVTNYRGVTLDKVRVRHDADVAGNRTMQLVARLGRYDGPILGSASVTRSITTAMTETVYDFNDTPVPAGSTIAFVETITAGTAPVYRDFGYEDCGNAISTDGTDAPLDSVRHLRVGLKISGAVSLTYVTAIEYYHTVFGHYFITADPGEIAGLDGGAYGGVFIRTGQQFYAWDGPRPGTVDVCRFFTTPGNFGTKSSHFYTGDAFECALVKTNPNWVYEKIAFFIKPPAAGVCTGFNNPVYRLYNNGMTGAPNHRFTRDLAIYNDFSTTQGWAPEGIRFCEPLLF